MANALPNHPDNPCIGCGPNNPAGLRLEFERDGAAVHTTLTARAEHEGWPGRLHSGILYLAMCETANWTVYGTLDRIGVPIETSALDLRRWVATGEDLTVEGRMDGTDADRPTVDVTATDANGDVVATLRRAFALPTRDEFLERMGYDEIPAGLEEALPS